jgi:hypothetical protein
MQKRVSMYMRDLPGKGMRPCQLDHTMPIAPACLIEELQPFALRLARRFDALEGALTMGSKCL